MNLQVEWGRPVQLKDALRENMIYGLDLSKVSPPSGKVPIARTYRLNAKDTILAF
jgi:hypothetical protein